MVCKVRLAGQTETAGRGHYGVVLKSCINLQPLVGCRGVVSMFSLGYYLSSQFNSGMDPESATPSLGDGLNIEVRQIALRALWLITVYFKRV